MCAVIPSFAQQIKSIENSKHNLSASGPGAIRASSEQEVCIFCHTPHNASPIQPAWNRNNPVSAYIVYSSQSMDAVAGQPTGSSKLCLSCHDGTIAVGSVLSRDQEIMMSGGTHALPAGKSNLGTDLSDDHPISFRYDSALAAKDVKLKDPGQLPQQVKLDKRGEMQCTSCHDAHDDANGAFLVMNNANSELCASCHRIAETTIASHANCNSCHVAHSSPSGPYLLTGNNLSDTCLKCHSGQPGLAQGTGVASDLNKLSRHDNPPPRGVLLGDASTYVSCNDCHEPHTMRSQTAVAPAISPKLGKVSGVNSAGVVVVAAQYQYEVCFKCHETASVNTRAISRQIVQTNPRLEFAPSAVSYHPVEAPGKNTNVPSLRPPLTTASIIYCTDCHASDTSKAAGSSGANGPHGSNSAPLLIARYEAADFTSESATAYALCYTCHERSSILSDESFPFHKKHVVDSRTPCSICHDGHGVSSTQGSVLTNAHLINFDITAVTPLGGKLEYRSLGANHGSCTLTCHGQAHNNTPY